MEEFEADDQGMILINDVLTDFGVQTVLTTWLVRDGYGFHTDVTVMDFEATPDIM